MYLLQNALIDIEFLNGIFVHVAVYTLLCPKDSRIDIRAWETQQIKNFEYLNGYKPPLNKNYR